TGNGRPRADLPRRGCGDGDRAEDRRARPGRARRRPDPGPARHALQRDAPVERSCRVIRLGRISYVNMAPVFFELEAEVEEVTGVPTELNQQLIAGEIDLAPISSIAYGRHADRLRILPRLCVSSEGAVDSIQLVSKTPLQHVRTHAVSPEAATSRCLS